MDQLQNLYVPERCQECPGVPRQKQNLLFLRIVFGLCDLRFESYDRDPTISDPTIQKCQYVNPRLLGYPRDSLRDSARRGF